MLCDYTPLCCNSTFLTFLFATVCPLTPRAGVEEAQARQIAELTAQNERLAKRNAELVTMNEQHARQNAELVAQNGKLTEQTEELHAVIASLKRSSAQVSLRMCLQPNVGD